MPDMAVTLPVEAARNKPRLLDQVRNAIRVKHSSIRTEQAYIAWIRRFILILYHGKPTANVTHPMWQNRPNASRLIPEVARCGVSLCRA
jgi:hypothetical protein